MSKKALRSKKGLLFKILVIAGLLFGAFSSLGLAEEITTYHIRVGDSLVKIARYHLTTLEDLLVLNPQITDPDNILVGAAIRVPLIVEVEPGSVSAQCQRNYTFGFGDSWASIAEYTGVNVEILALVNHRLATDPLSFGDTLCIPIQSDSDAEQRAKEVEDKSGDSADGRASDVTASTPELDESDGFFHVLQQGEYLSLIATHYNCSVNTIVAVNNIRNPSLIKVNTWIWIPADCTNPQAPSAPTLVPTPVPQIPAPTPAAPTLQPTLEPPVPTPLPTPVPPTATPLPTSVPATLSPTPTPVPPTPISIQVVAPPQDHGINLLACNAGDEYVTFRNDSGQLIDLTGYLIHDEGPNFTYEFEAGFQVGPGETWTLVSGPGAAKTGPRQLVIYSRNIWNNGGDTAYLKEGAVLVGSIACQ